MAKKTGFTGKGPSKSGSNSGTTCNPPHPGMPEATPKAGENMPMPASPMGGKPKKMNFGKK